MNKKNEVVISKPQNSFLRTLGLLEMITIKKFPFFYLKKQGSQIIQLPLIKDRK